MAYIRDVEHKALSQSKLWTVSMRKKKLKVRLHSPVEVVGSSSTYALSKMQGEDPGEIRAKSQSGTQQDAKRGFAREKRNGKKRETAK
jgi:hypothetical protein